MSDNQSNSSSTPWSWAFQLFGGKANISDTHGIENGISAMEKKEEHFSGIGPKGHSLDLEVVNKRLSSITACAPVGEQQEVTACINLNKQAATLILANKSGGTASLSVIPEIGSMQAGIGVRTHQYDSPSGSRNIDWNFFHNTGSRQYNIPPSFGAGVQVNMKF